MRVVVFGAGEFGHKYCERCDGSTEIVAVSDSNKSLWKNKCVLGHRVIPPAEILMYNFDRVVIALSDLHHEDVIAAIMSQLLELGIESDKIVLQNMRYPINEPRVQFLRHFAKLFESPKFAVAECGVYRGEFAGYINEYFPLNKLYLFDAFEGFREYDQLAENSLEAKSWLAKGAHIDHNLSGNELPALLRCPHRGRVVLRKGFIPDTFKDTPDETYGFVNLDMDLYLPTLEALHYFSTRMERNGIILLHDYFCSDLPGIKQSVDEFSNECKFCRMPIGDEFSLALTNLSKE